MSWSALLLRVALCVALVANGMSAAMAGVRMAANAPVAQHADHCHDAATSADPTGATADHPHPGAKHDACCHVGACACHCVPQAQLAVVAPIVILPTPLHDVVVHAPSAARESPRLAHLIRPPIDQAS